MCVPFSGKYEPSLTAEGIVASQRQQAGNGWQQLMAIALNGTPLQHLATVMTAAPLIHSGRQLKLTKRFPMMPFW
jgi:homoserine dehydrogenase